MKSHTWMWMTVGFLFALTIPVGVTAQNNPSQDNKHKHQRYKLIDMGTFGGPQSYFIFIGARSLSSSGIAAGAADTSGRLTFPPKRTGFRRHAPGETYARRED